MLNERGIIMTDVITAITTALTTVQTNLMTAFGDVLPIALAIMGVGIVVTLAIKHFKKVASK